VDGTTNNFESTAHRIWQNCLMLKIILRSNLRTFSANLRELSCANNTEQEIE
jgi:hypothetical protein